MSLMRRFYPRWLRRLYYGNRWFSRRCPACFRPPLPTRVALPDVRRVYPPLDARSICSPESVADTRRMLADLGRLARAQGVQIVIEPGSPMSAELDKAING